MQRTQPTDAFTLDASMRMASRRYDNHSLLRVFGTSAALRRLHTLAPPSDFQFWTLPREHQAGHDVQADVLANPGQQTALEGIARDAGIRGVRMQVLIENIQANLNIQHARRTSEGAEATPHFRDYEETRSHIAHMVAMYPACASMHVIGTSYEGRDLVVVQIRSSNASAGARPGFFVQSLLHAREWLGGASALWMIEHMLRKHRAQDASVTRLLERFDLFFLPMANPDGYMHTHTTDRMWRKTRSIHQGSECIGADPNRNFDEQWSGIGSNWESVSRDPCSEVYHGPRPASEPEVATIQTFLRSRSFAVFVR